MGGSEPVEGTGSSETTAPPDSKQSAAKSDWEKDQSAWKVTIYPVFLWAPVFGAHVDMPNLPAGPSGPRAGSASSSFNGAGFAGFEIEKSRWVANGQFLLASVSGDGTDPKAHVGLRILYGQATGGYQVLPGLSLEGGVRRMSLKISASVGDQPEVSTKPGIWDPLIGTTWRHQFGKKWRLQAHLDGGGFGVGSDLTLGAAVRADWRFAKHFGLTMGAGGLHFRVTNTIADNAPVKKTLEVKQTLYGPILGFGIYF